MRKIIVLVFACVFLFSGVAHADLIFYDGFEYSDLPENHGWVVQQQTNTFYDAYTSTDRKVSGDRSLYLGNGNIARYYFNEIDTTYVDKISVYYFDDLFAGGNWDAGGLVGFDDSSKIAQILWYNPPNYIYNTVVNNILDIANTTTSVPRSLGWHKFEWAIEDNFLDLYIDDILVADDIMNVSSLSFIQIYTGGEPDYAYYDNVVVTGRPVPEPATMLLLGSGIAGLTAFRRKMLKRT